MRGLGDLTLDVEVEYALSRTCPLLGQPKIFIRSSSVRRAFITITNEINVGVILVRGPMLAEIVEETVPGRQAVSSKVRDRE